MAKKKSSTKNTCDCSCGKMNKCDGSSAFYFFGFIGAAIFYISTATGFWMGVLGFLKAMIWPVFLVYEALKFLVM